MIVAITKGLDLIRNAVSSGYSVKTKLLSMQEVCMMAHWIIIYTHGEWSPCRIASVLVEFLNEEPTAFQEELPSHKTFIT